MTEAELWELNLLAVANTLTAFSVYLTVAFAYLAASYFVGSSLSRLQAFVISCLFIFASASCIGACTAQLHRASDFQKLLSSQSNEMLLMPLQNASFWATYMPFLMGTGVIVSLYFMYNTRSKIVLDRTLDED